MGDDINFVGPVFFLNLKNFLLKDIGVVLNRSERLNLTSMNLVTLNFEDSLNLAKRLHENAVSDSEAVYEDDRVTGVHRV